MKLRKGGGRREGEDERGANLGRLSGKERVKRRKRRKYAKGGVKRRKGGKEGGREERKEEEGRLERERGCTKSGEAESNENLFFFYLS